MSRAPTVDTTATTRQIERAEHMACRCRQLADILARPGGYQALYGDPFGVALPAELADRMGAAVAADDLAEAERWDHVTAQARAARRAITTNQETR